MKICSMEAELFHADRRTDGRTDILMELEFSWQILEKIFKYQI